MTFLLGVPCINLFTYLLSYHCDPSSCRVYARLAWHLDLTACCTDKGPRTATVEGDKIILRHCFASPESKCITCDKGFYRRNILWKSSCFNSICCLTNGPQPSSSDCDVEKHSNLCRPELRNFTNHFYHIAFITMINFNYWLHINLLHAYLH